MLFSNLSIGELVPIWFLPKDNNNKMVKKITLLFILVYYVEKSLLSQDSTVYNNSENITEKDFTPTIISGTILSIGEISYLNYNYHKADPRVPFHFYNDNRGNLQIDKFQHAYGSYVETYIGYHLLRNAGAKKKISLIYGGTFGFVLQSQKEIFDGFHDPGGFSWGDIVANASGSAFLIFQEILYDEQVLKFKFSFSRSEYANQANGYLGRTVWGRYSHDYNGHTYWLSINANRIFLKTKLPGWINIAAGYSANGMFGPFENIKSYGGVNIPETQRYRQFLLSLDIDWSQIHTKSKFVRIILEGLNFIKMPFPTIEINSQSQVRGYWIYF